MSVNFRTRMFGGFDREDVVAYIEKIAKENQTQVDELTRTADDLRQQNGELSQQLAILRRQVENCEDSRRENVELTQQVHQEKERGDELQVQADEYARIRDHIAEIEISAHRRTEEFRSQTIARIHGLVAQQRTWCSENSARYEELLQRFGEKLQAARNVLQETDLSGFDDMLRSLNELDEELDK